MLESLVGVTMTYFYPLLLVLGMGGSLLLLGLGSFTGLRTLRKPVSAVWATALALLWSLAPSEGQWVLSVWRPTDVAGGLLVLDLQPAIWWLVLLLLVAAAGALWTSVAEQAGALPLTGVLLLILLTVTWLGVASGSLLMTLAMWTLFDVVWFLARLVGGADGERVVWASALNGAASLLLWSVSLLLLRDGDSGLWWLVRPSESARALLTLAAFLRIGFYPFQIVHAETLRRSRVHVFMSVLNPLMGVALLYRLISLPVAYGLPSWAIGWGCLSVLWSGLKSFSLLRRAALLPAGFGLLLAAVTGAIVTSDGDLLLVGVGVWVMSIALVLLSRRLERRAVPLVWPTLIAGAMLLGTPPSPLFGLYTAVLAAAPWGWRVAFLIGMVGLAASLLRGLVSPAEGRVRPAWPRLTLALVGGVVISLGGLVAIVLYRPVDPIQPLPLALWVFAVLGGGLLVRWGRDLQRMWIGGQPVIQLLDLQWLYRAAWQGSENLLGVLRVTAEVVEGSGSILWSVLVLLLILLILGGG